MSAEATGAPPLAAGAALAPVLFHAHGIAEHDFSSLTAADLPLLEAEAARRGVDLVPTIFLRRSWLDPFAATLTAYGERRAELPHILGFAIEGPMLGPEGGTPRAASWIPTVSEWRRLAALGDVGLRYVVIAPDAMDLDAPLRPGFRFRDLVESFYEHGVKVALGHFRRDDPQRSAERVRALVAFVHERADRSRFAVLTDHLFNDMPRNFRHSWRGPDRADRDRELAAFLATPWRDDLLPALLGAVPAALLETAREGGLTPCLNFDGEHVDLAICERTLAYVGAGNLIAISDHIECDTMAGEDLHPMDGSSLWLREDDVVAAGSSGLDVQIANMRAIGMTAAQIALVLSDNPRQALTRV